MADFRDMPLVLGQSVSGILEAGDNLDYYLIRLEPGAVYYFDFEGSAGYGITDGVLADFSQPGNDGHYLISQRLAENGAVRIEISETLAAGETSEYSFTLSRPTYVPASAGDDWIQWQGDDVFYEGGPGQDMLSFVDQDQGVTFDFWRGSVRIGEDTVGGRFNGGDRGQIVWRGFEAFTGTSQDDHFIGGFGGQSGDFEMRGLGGRDLFEASFDREVFDGGAGWDSVQLSYADVAVPDEHVSLLRGKGWAGTAAGDRFIFIEEIRSGAGNDQLTGDHSANRLIGGSGDDTLMGNAGDDVLVGGRGEDVALFSYARDQYVIGPQVPGDAFSPTEVRYIGEGGGDGTDYLTEIEILRFVDGDVLL